MTLKKFRRLLEFEKKIWAPPGGQTGSVPGYMTIYAESYP